MKILLIDNYDSFTYNLLETIRRTGLCSQIDIKKNDEMDWHISGDNFEDYNKIIFSPGAGLPIQAPIMSKIIHKFGNSKPILGICLGHQAIAEHFGGKLYNLNRVRHGLTLITNVVRSDYIFNGINSKFNAGLYHSFAVDQSSLPDVLETTSVASDGTIMSLRHKELDIRGVQFHPESILTDLGAIILSNWLKN